LKSQVGPVVVPNERDDIAASMRKSEFRIQISDFRIPTSHFPLPYFDLRIQINMPHSNIGYNTINHVDKTYGFG